jgi:hypothetical protein
MKKPTCSWIPALFLLATSCLDGHDHGPFDAEPPAAAADTDQVLEDIRQDSSGEGMALSFTPPPRISIESPTAEAKPSGFGVDACPPDQTPISGGPGADFLTATRGNTCLVGLEGNDMLIHMGSGSMRTALGGPGRDIISASSAGVLVDGWTGTTRSCSWGDPTKSTAMPATT